MRVRLAVALACCLVTIACARQSQDTRERPWTYELYSWQGPSGEWNFCLLVTTDRNKGVEEIFNEKTTLRGVAELKRKISELPKGSTIVWADRQAYAGVGVEGYEALRYPGEKIVGEVRRYADTRNVKVLGPENE